MTSIYYDYRQKEPAGNDKNGSASFIIPDPNSSQCASVRLKDLRT